MAPPNKTTPIPQLGKVVHNVLHLVPTNSNIKTLVNTRNPKNIKWMMDINKNYFLKRNCTPPSMINFIVWIPSWFYFSSFHFITVQSKIQYGDKLCFEFPTLFDSWKNHPTKNIILKLLFIFVYNYTAPMFFYYAKIGWVENPVLKHPAEKNQW